MLKQLLINNTLELYSKLYLLCQHPLGFTANLSWGSGFRNKKKGFYLHRKEPDARSGKVTLSLRSHTGETKAALQGPHHFASCQNPRHFEEILWLKLNHKYFLRFLLSNLF